MRNEGDNVGRFAPTVSADDSDFREASRLILLPKALFLSPRDHVEWNFFDEQRKANNTEVIPKQRVYPQLQRHKAFILVSNYALPPSGMDHVDRVILSEQRAISTVDFVENLATKTNLHIIEAKDLGESRTTRIVLGNYSFTENAALVKSTMSPS